MNRCGFNPPNLVIRTRRVSTITRTTYTGGGGMRIPSDENLQEDLACPQGQMIDTISFCRCEPKMSLSEHLCVQSRELEQSKSSLRHL